MSEQTAAAEPQDQAPQATEGAPVTESQTPDLSAVMERMNEIGQRLDSFQPPSAQQGIAEQVAQPFDPYQGQPQFDDDDGYDEPDQQAQVQALEQFVQQRVNQALNPIVEQQRNERIQQQAIALEQKYPELAKPEVAGPVVQAAQQYAQNLGFQLGLNPEQVQNLARSPQFIETFYQAQRASQRAEQETPADALSNVQLEGAAAQSQQPEMDDFDRMANAKTNGGGFKWS